jgi:Na+/proline symporter
MKRDKLRLPEVFYGLAFLLYLGGSSLALIQNGVELSLWLMAFAVVATVSTTLLPVLGFIWLKLPRQGCRVGWWIALLLQLASWGTFAAAMFLRLNREVDGFKTLIAVTTLLWAGWLLVFIYSRHACRPGDKLNGHTATEPPEQKKHEES